jgi:hypothetical protein
MKARLRILRTALAFEREGGGKTFLAELAHFGTVGVGVKRKKSGGTAHAPPRRGPRG